METRANYIAVGIFTLATFVGAFLLTYWFGRYGDTDNMADINVRIQGSVSGLGAGSLVQFNGITVGRVTGLSLDNDDPRFVIVHAEVNEQTPIRSDTRANIGIRGLSGGAFIQLEGGSPTAPSLISTTGPQQLNSVPQIVGDPAALADLLTRINGIAAQTERVMATLEKFATQNDQTVSNTLINVEQFSQALAANSDGVEKFLSSAADVGTALSDFSAKLDGSLGKLEVILDAVDTAKIADTVSNVEAFTGTLAEQRLQLASVFASVSQTASLINDFSKDLSTTMKKVDVVVSGLDSKGLNSAINNIDQTSAKLSKVLDAVDRNTVGQTLDDISAAARGVRSMVDGLDQNTINSLMSDIGAASKNVTTLISAIDAARVNQLVADISGAAESANKAAKDISNVTGIVGDKSDEIQKIITDASELTARLNASSKKIDSLVSSANSLLGGGAGDGLVNDVQQTLAEFRRTARILNQRVTDITGSVSQFTKRGLGETQGLINDARRSINRIDRVIRNLENNPSSLITGNGGSRVKESGSARPRR